ncbi:hypothetical protein [[Mycoplasma] collis]|uniref:hypothetical protein n=1 Tax=[Mycoplasma] collis TaxID=2127 RepID=UPI00051C45D0|nr:hypothetical protein [[Mycoplasma] collis]
MLKLLNIILNIGAVTVSNNLIDPYLFEEKTIETFFKKYNHEDRKKLKIQYVTTINELNNLNHKDLNLIFKELFTIKTDFFHNEETKKHFFDLYLKIDRIYPKFLSEVKYDLPKIRGKRSILTSNHHEIIKKWINLIKDKKEQYNNYNGVKIGLGIGGVGARVSQALPFPFNFIALGVTAVTTAIYIGAHQGTIDSNYYYYDNILTQLNNIYDEVLISNNKSNEKYFINKLKEIADEVNKYNNNLLNKRLLDIIEDEKNIKNNYFANYKGY